MSLRTALDNLKTTIGSISGQFQKLTNTYNANQKEIKDEIQNISGIVTQISVIIDSSTLNPDLRSELEETKNRLATTQQELNECNRRSQQLEEEKNRQIQTLTQQNNELTNEKEQLKTQIDNLTQEENKLTQEINDINATLVNELKNAIDTINTSFTNETNDVKQQLTQLKNNIQAILTKLQAGPSIPPSNSRRPRQQLLYNNISQRRVGGSSKRKTRKTRKNKKCKKQKGGYTYKSNENLDKTSSVIDTKMPISRKYSMRSSRRHKSRK